MAFYKKTEEIKAMKREKLEEYAIGERNSSWTLFGLYVFALAVIVVVMVGMGTLYDNYKADTMDGMMTMGNEMCEHRFNEQSTNVRIFDESVQVFCESEFIGIGD